MSTKAQNSNAANSRRAGDDLFEHTRMSFGQHLEELRKVLFRALIGVAIGSAIGLYFGNQIIAILSQPLTDSIQKFNQNVAKNKIAEEVGWVPPEFDEWFRLGLVPNKALVDPDEVAKVLRQVDPTALPLDTSAKDFYSILDFPRDVLVPVAKRLVSDDAAAQTSGSRVLWEILSTEHRELIEKLAKADVEPTVEDSEKFLGALNSLLDNESLRLQEPFSKIVENKISTTEWLMGAKPIPGVEKMQEKLSASFDKGLNRKLNRMLVHRVFADIVPPLKSNLVPFTTWLPVDTRTQSLAITEPFMIWMKAGLVAGLFLSSPWVFYQIWTFVAVGLYPHEQRYVHLYLPISLGLFLSGIFLAYFFVFDPVLQFMFSFNAEAGIEPQPRISDWLSFVLMLPLGFGIAFQLPLIMLFMNRIGLFTIEQYLAKWRIAVMIIFILAMVLTPADPISMLLLAVPLTFLYFFGVGLCRWMPAHRNPFADDPLQMAR
ncbi:MAG: twin-arginine translocase subunit TatC [Pirellulaceae bacterium]